MTAEPLKVLVVEDSYADAQLLKSFFARIRPHGRSILTHHVTTMGAGLAEVENGHFDCVIVDYALGDGSGLELIHQILASKIDVPIVVVSGFGSEQVAVNTLKIGAQDYLVKGELSASKVERALCNAIDIVSTKRKEEECELELQAFVQLAAHDMRAPLRQIIANYNVIQEDCQDEIGEHLGERLDSIAVCASRMGSLLDSLLQYSQVGRSQCDMDEVNLSDVVDVTLENLASDIEQRGATVTVEQLPSVVGH